ncbi:MAG: arylesterase [Alphaproteobacteria bacterium]|nr:arylesterase [Alphaproteobacteria bacterium]
MCSCPIAFNAFRRYGPLARRINGVLLVLILAWTLPTGVSRAETITLLGFGDSLMAGYGLPQQDAFPTVLEAALQARGHDVRVLNAGVSGDTTAGGRARLGWSLSPAPDAVILELGANDGLRGIPTEETRRNLDAILAMLADQGIPALLAGMLAPPNMGREYGVAVKAMFADLAGRYDVVFYPFFLDGVAARAELNQQDGIHPNAVGVETLVERILPSVETLIAKVKTNRSG